LFHPLAPSVVVVLMVVVVMGEGGAHNKFKELFSK
jgi:hypothetical protein